jgi:hypothetical protein
MRACLIKVEVLYKTPRHRQWRRAGVVETKLFSSLSIFRYWMKALLYPAKQPLILYSKVGLYIVRGKVVPVFNKLSTTPWRRMGEWYIDSQFLDLGTSWRWVVSFTPLPLYSYGKSPRYLLVRKLGRSQGQSGWYGEEKILDPTEAWTLTPR